jgi:hypothetical protein
LEVEEAVPYAAESAISQQVILLVGIEGAGHDLLENGTPPSFPKEGYDVLDRIIPQDAAKFFVFLDDAGSHQLVNLLALLIRSQNAAIGVPRERGFGDMTERTMSDVMEQRGELDQSKVLALDP